MKTNRPKHVVVALRMAGIAGQDKLNGIFEYLSQGPRWDLAIYRTLHEFTAATTKADVVARRRPRTRPAGDAKSVPASRRVTKALRPNSRPSRCPHAHLPQALLPCQALAEGI